MAHFWKWIETFKLGCNQKLSKKFTIKLSGKLGLKCHLSMMIFKKLCMLFTETGFRSESCIIFKIFKSCNKTLRVSDYLSIAPRTLKSNKQDEKVYLLRTQRHSHQVSQKLVHLKTWVSQWLLLVSTGRYLKHMSFHLAKNRLYDNTSKSSNLKN